MMRPGHINLLLGNWIYWKNLLPRSHACSYTQLSARCSSDPKVVHSKAVKWIGWYLVGIRDKGIMTPDPSLSVEVHTPTPTFVVCTIPRWQYLTPSQQNLAVDTLSLTWDVWSFGKARCKWKQLFPPLRPSAMPAPKPFAMPSPSLIFSRREQLLALRSDPQRLRSIVKFSATTQQLVSSWSICPRCIPGPNTSTPTPSFQGARGSGNHHCSTSVHGGSIGGYCHKTSSFSTLSQVLPSHSRMVTWQTSDKGVWKFHISHSLSFIGESAE